MIRKLLFTLGAALALLAPASSPVQAAGSTTSAAIGKMKAQCRCYYVAYWSGCCWRYYGPYTCSCEASRAAQQLQRYYDFVTVVSR